MDKIKLGIEYILDTNAIREIGFEHIENIKSKGNIVVTIEDVKSEIEGNDKLNRLSGVISLKKESYIVLENLIKNSPEARQLLDYYNNKGQADAPLLAYALTPQEGMFEYERVIVTNDKPLQSACGKCKVTWIASKAFLSQW